MSKARTHSASRGKSDARTQAPPVFVQLSPRGTVTLPKQYRGESRLLAVIKREDGVIELHPKVAVDQSQAWFWTDRWQKMEREADADIRAGRVTVSDNIDELFKHLDS